MTADEEPELPPGVLARIRLLPDEEPDEAEGGEQEPTRPSA